MKKTLTRKSYEELRHLAAMYTSAIRANNQYAATYYKENLHNMLSCAQAQIWYFSRDERRETTVVYRDITIYGVRYNHTTKCVEVRAQYTGDILHTNRYYKLAEVNFDFQAGWQEEYDLQLYDEYMTDLYGADW